jgi:hypothetical protein
MLKKDNIKIICCNKTKSYYLDKGYLSEDGFFTVKIIDLPSKSHQKIDVICDVCGAEKHIMYSSYLDNINAYNIYACCQKCASFKNKLTCEKKYGYDNPMKVFSIKEKNENSNLEKYGYKNVFGSDIIKDKIRNTNIKKYGTEYFSQSDFGKQKIKEKFQELYNYGHPLRDDNIKAKIKDTNIKKYNYDNPSKSSIIKEKVKISHIKKCGEVSNLVIFNKNKKSIYFEYIKNELYPIYDVMNYNGDILEIKHNVCGETSYVKRNNLYDRLNVNKVELCLKCNPLNSLDSSKEKNVYEWIASVSGMGMIKSDRLVLNGKELDIYLPLVNLAIEFNGLYWHSENFKDKNYHLDKSLKCQEKGIQLLHIWEDEWIFKQDIIKSIILNKLGLIKEKIYARNCDIRVVEDSKLIRQFLDENHIQGYSQSSIKLGLFYQNELVSLMTFGYRHTNSKKEFELIRFCNKINLNVIGASSKLFNYFKLNYTFTELISYSDFRLFDGKMYQTLGFTKQHLSKPDYFWCKDLERKHRFNFNKQKLIKEGYDKNKTEVEIMYERGYYRLFSCGQYRWVYNFK